MEGEASIDLDVGHSGGEGAHKAPRVAAVGKERRWGRNGEARKLGGKKRSNMLG